MVLVCILLILNYSRVTGSVENLDKYISGLMSRHLSPGQKKVIPILFGVCDLESAELCTFV